jgi:predicted AlkP superfamily pyrophosphatase or phosphodiesterase
MPNRVSLLRRVAVSLSVVFVLAHGGTSRGQDRVPRLIVLLMVDQFRSDYVDRLQHQWTGGLHRLETEGAWFRDAEYPYFNTATCPGHASVSTGTMPAIHGMILNQWWDRESRSPVACADDAAVKIISYGKPVTVAGESAARLLAPTLADELRAQLSPASHVIAFSLKARSAVTLGGQHPDAVAWFADQGAWVTSTAFSPGPVREVADFISHRPVEQDLGKVWDRTLPKSAYLYEDPAVGITGGAEMTSGFPHTVRNYAQWQSSPYADEYLAQMALDVATRMKLGASGRVDMIAISFSTLDFVGHLYGPNSHEIQDVLIRLDRALGSFFAGLDRLVGSGNYVVALTADHGVAPVPERARLFGLDSGRVPGLAIVGAAEQAAVRALGPGKYVSRLELPEIYFEPGVYDKLRRQPSALESVRNAIKSVTGVTTTYTRDELEQRRFGEDPVARQIANSHLAARSGDISIVLRPYWMTAAAGTTHGTGYGYDTRVPLFMMGKGIRRGEYLVPVSPLDIAPTLALLSGITLPRAQGRILIEALPAPRSVPPND